MCVSMPARSRDRTMPDPCAAYVTDPLFCSPVAVVELIFLSPRQQGPSPRYVRNRFFTKTASRLGIERGGLSAFSLITNKRGPSQRC